MKLWVKLLPCIVCFAFIFPSSPVASEQHRGGEVLEILGLQEEWTGDFDGMVTRRKIRALVVFNKMMYFLDGPIQHGASYELLKEFERFVNERLNTKTLQIHVIFIPVTRDQLIPALLDGRGDIAAANLTVTDERTKLVDFSDPILKGVSEVLVTGPAAPPVSNLNELSGKEIYVRRSSSYFTSLQRLNASFKQKKMPAVELILADENLEDSDLLEMTNAGLIPMVTVDNHKAQFWQEIFDDISVHSDITVNSGGKIAWAFRKDSPNLKKTINAFVVSHKKGTLMGNILYKRYLRENKWARNALTDVELSKFNDTVELFKRYAGRYDFDWLMLAALGYQESGLDQTKRSHTGAVGVMQILPTTAADPNVGITNIEELEGNIHAGTKYLRFLRDRYFNDKDIDPLNRMLFTFAAYNAGPAKLARLRNEAAKMGLDRRKWFRNVEVIAAKRIGRETVQYVSNIYKYYVTYSLIVDRLKSRKQTKSAGTPLQSMGDSNQY